MTLFTVESELLARIRMKSQMLHTFIFNEKEGVRMSMSIDARINTGYNGSNDGVTIFGKRIRINILKKGSMLIKF